MKKTFLAAAVAILVAAQAFSAYVVVLKDGTQYKAKAKWTVVNGKALLTLESGQLLQVDPALIDVAKTERTNKLGVTGQLLNLTPDVPQQEAPKPQPSLGSRVKLKPLPPEKRPTPAPETPLPGSTAEPASATPPAGGGAVSAEVLEKFDRAYENVGIFEKKIAANGPRGVHAELTADGEDKVFNAISATSFLLVRNGGVPGAQIDTVELFMKTTNGGAAGRFVMTRADAEALDKKTMTQQDYFVRRVIY